MTDTQILDWLQEELAVHEGGMNGSFNIHYDDATFQVLAFKKKHYKNNDIHGAARNSVRGALIDLIREVKAERENRKLNDIPNL